MYAFYMYFFHIKRYYKHKEINRSFEGEKMTQQLHNKLKIVQKAYEEENAAQFFTYMPDLLDELYKEHRIEEYITYTMHCAILYFRHRNLTLASSLLSDKSITIEEHATPLQKIRYYNLLAALQGEVGSLKDMVPFLLKAKMLAEEHHAIGHLAQIYHNLSIYYLKTKDFENSLYFARKSITYYHEDPSIAHYEFLLLNYSKVLVEVDSWEEATDILNQARTLIKRRPMNYYDVRLIIAEAHFLEKQHHLNEALQLLLDALQQFENHPKWCLDLYEKACPIAKVIYTPKTYFDLLKKYQHALQKGIELEKNIEIEMVIPYFNDAPYKEIAWQDALTKLHNRKYVEDHIQSWQQKHPSYSVILFDIDHFKVMNDTYGHLYGDMALQQLASTCKPFFNKQKALFVRLGGDEFFALLPLTTEEKMQFLIKELYRELTHVELAKPTIKLTISLGAYVETNPNISLKELIQKADIALYQSKQNGRNQFTIVH